MCSGSKSRVSSRDCAILRPVGADAGRELYSASPSTSSERPYGCCKTEFHCDAGSTDRGDRRGALRSGSAGRVLGPGGAREMECLRHEGSRQTSVGDRMIEPSVRFPVICPECQREVLASLPVGLVAGALIRQRGIRLYSSCHDIYWDASPIELEQLRQYMGAAWIDAQGL